MRDTLGPPTGGDSPWSVASGRNRENSVPLRVTHKPSTQALNWPNYAVV
jgi:hypothetical protein